MQQAQVIMLELHYPLGERVQVVYPVLAMDEKACVLVDCGYPGSVPLLQRTLKKKGVSLAEVTHLILTHHDLDSAGCAGELVQAYPHIQVLATPQQEPFLRRERPSLRWQQMQQVYANAQQSEALERVETLFEAVQPVAVSRLIKDGDTFDVAGGLRIVETPGHMPGHVSVYLPAYQALVAGDALMAQKGALALPDQALTLDREAAVRSVRALAALPLRAVLCYHGGAVTGDIPQLLQGL